MHILSYSVLQFADTHKTARSSSSAMDVWAWPFVREDERIDGMTRGKKENQG